jgi:hypothetical protein
MKFNRQRKADILRYLRQLFCLCAAGLADVIISHFIIYLQYSLPFMATKKTLNEVFNSVSLSGCN